jgi:hypothetical protein
MGRIVATVLPDRIEANVLQNKLDFVFTVTVPQNKQKTFSPFLRTRSWNERGHDQEDQIYWYYTLNNYVV